MNILTDEEIAELKNQHFVMDRYGEVFEFNKFARSIEAAVMSKLAEQAGEPVAWWVPEAEQFAIMDKPGSRPFAKAFEPLYTETQLIAAQQRTAEACAKVAEAERSEDGDGQHPAWYAGFDACAEAIRNGEWREYL